VRERSAITSYEGTHSLKFTADGSGDGVKTQISTSQQIGYFDLFPGKEYTLSFYLKPASAGQDSMYIRLVESDGGGYSIDQTVTGLTYLE
tara:strand:- start:191 stop:460 length:270 start_codon:yes stop_codon:yes gene_type:complete